MGDGVGVGVDVVFNYVVVGDEFLGGGDVDEVVIYGGVMNRCVVFFVDGDEDEVGGDGGIGVGVGVYGGMFGVVGIVECIVKRIMWSIGGVFVYGGFC